MFAGMTDLASWKGGDETVLMVGLRLIAWFLDSTGLS